MSQNGDEEPEEAGSSWWNFFYDSAKRKLAETNEFVMHDMREFADTVKTDASKLVAATATSMKDQLNIKVDLEEASQATKVVTNTLSGFLGSVVSHVTPQSPDSNENDDSTAYVGTYSGVKVVSPAEARLFALQTDPATYCNEPDNSHDFELWLKSFNLDDRKEEISLVMLDCKEVRSLYTKLVPDAVTHLNFWTRFYFKREQLEKSEKKRAELVQRAEEKQTELSWDDEEDLDASPSQPCPPADEATTESIPLEVTPEQTTSEEVKADRTHAEPSPVTQVTAEPLPREIARDNAPPDVSTDSPPPGVSTDSSPPEVSTDSSPPDVSTDSSPPGGDVVNSAPETPVASNVQKPEEDICQSKNVLDSVMAKVEPELDVVNTTESVNPSTESSQEIPVQKESQPEVSVKESSSGGSSDWEKEFDLEMTEDEIKEALLEDGEELNEGDIEGWEDWE